MKSFSFLSLLLMASMFLFLGGCQKDLDNPVKVESRTTVELTGSNDGFPSDHVFSKRPNVCPNENSFPENTWNPSSVLRAFHVYYQLKCGNEIDISKFGEPVWSSTICYNKDGKKYSITPLESNTENDKYGFMVYADESKIGFHFLNVDSGDIQAIWPFGGGIDCPTFAPGWLLKIGNFFVDIWGDIIDVFSGSGGGGGSGSFTVFSAGGSTVINSGVGNTDPNPSGGIYGGGGGGSGDNGYINPMGTYMNCDFRLQTVEGCKAFFARMGIQVKDDPNLEEKIVNCGCYRAVLHTDSWEGLSREEKCLDCLGGKLLSNVENAKAFALLEDFISHVEFPCQSVDQDAINKIKENVYNEACNFLVTGKRINPGALLSKTLNELEKLQYDYIARSSIFLVPLSGASYSVGQMAALFNLSPAQVRALPNDVLCQYLSISECLTPTETETLGFSNATKKEILKWYLSKGKDKLSSDIIDGICSGNDGGSGNSVNVEDLESKYLHEKLKLKYVDYSSANVNFDLFISTYGTDKYIILANAYENYNNLNLGMTWLELVEGLNEYLSLSDPNNIDNGQSNVNNEITVTNITPLIIPLSGANIGGSPARGNTEDLLYGDGGDSGVLLGGFSDSHYFVEMRGLFAAMTIGSTFNTGQQFIDQFEINQSVDFNMIKMPLIQKVSESGALKDYLKIFGERLKDRLRIIGGNNSQNIGQINLGDIRPKFSSYGLQILLNDTEQAEISLINYNYNSTSKQFDADVFIEITDHFGLDKKDVLKFQLWGLGAGFVGWWRLQHMSGYKPFKTKLYLRATITGTL